MILAHEFTRIVHNRRAEDLDAWIDLASGEDAPADLRSFARGLTHDHAAVSAALTLPWRRSNLADINAVLKSEIRRLARREIRSEMAVAQRAISQYRKDIAALKRQVTGQARTIAFLRRQEQRRLGKKPSPKEAKGVRFSAKGLKAYRSRLGISAQDFAKLVGVSALTIYNWESGKTRPRPQQLAALTAVRGLGKREVLKRLEML